MNADRLREQLAKEWRKALADLANKDAWDTECDVGEARADEALRVLHRIATAGGIELPNVPGWLNEDRKPTTFDNRAWSTFDQRQALEEGWFIAWCDGRGILEIQRDDAANMYERPALGLRVFNDDEEVLEFVTKHAADGSRYHQQALAIVRGQLF
jgi:hypothetical protein